MEHQFKLISLLWIRYIVSEIGDVKCCEGITKNTVTESHIKLHVQLTDISPVQLLLKRTV